MTSDWLVYFLLPSNYALLLPCLNPFSSIPRVLATGWPKETAFPACPSPAEVNALLSALTAPSAGLLNSAYHTASYLPSTRPPPPSFLPPFLPSFSISLASSYDMGLVFFSVCNVHVGNKQIPPTLEFETTPLQKKRKHILSTG